MRLRLPWMRRTRAASPGAVQARREAELSRQRQREVREEIIRPLDRYAQNNQFANIIRASLREGRGRR